MNSSVVLTEVEAAFAITILVNIFFQYSPKLLVEVLAIL